MGQIREIRKQVASIASTRKITSAMEMVAASKMRRSEELMEHARPYAQHIRNVAGHVATATPEYLPKLMRERPMEHVAWILVSSDKGLCGGLNQNLFRLLLHQKLEMMDKYPNLDWQASVLGLKGEAFCRRMEMPYTSIGKIGENPQPDRVLAAVQPLLEAFAAGKIDRIYLASNVFVNTVSQVPTILQLAPVEPIETEVYKRPHTDLPWDYIYEPEATHLLDELMQRYVESVVYEAVLENHACEQAAKMVAMKNATENAGDLMDGLQLAYNNARQAAITAELADIIGGAEAV